MNDEITKENQEVRLAQYFEALDERIRTMKDGEIEMIAPGLPGREQLDRLISKLFSIFGKDNRMVTQRIYAAHLASELAARVFRMVQLVMYKE